MGVSVGLFPEDEVADDSRDEEEDDEDEAGIAAAFQEFHQVAPDLRHLLCVLVDPCLQVVEQLLLDL